LEAIAAALTTVFAWTRCAAADNLNALQAQVDGPPMKNGKPKKNSAAPLTAEKSSRRPSKRNSPPLSEVVAETRAASKQVEPAPQPSLPRSKKAALKKMGPARTEPDPQPRMAKRTRVAAPQVKPLVEKNEPIEPSKIIPAPEAATALQSEVASAPARPSVPGLIMPKPRPVRQPRPVPAEIPPILLEPDHVPNEPAIAGPGARFALTPKTETAIAGQPHELPESYGTQRIFLAARDPYCLFASWDLDLGQRARYNAASASGALTIRLRRGFVEGPVFLEVHALPNARDRFIEGAQPDATFVAELGYHEKNSGAWRTISFSKPVTTPRDRVAAPSIEITPVVTESTPAAQVEKQPGREEIIFAIQMPQTEGRWVAKQEPEPFREVPRRQPSKAKPRWSAPKPVAAPKWTPSKTKALDELISLEFRHMQHGSLEIEELLRRRVLHRSEEGAPSSFELQELGAEEILAEALGLARPEAPSSLDVTTRLAEARPDFWFRVNAELIIYGSTEPGAHVSIGGRPIRLRPDGSFSYRFALPDGAYELPVIALAHDGHDGRAAELRFSRASFYSGDVPAQAQDPALKPPSPANL
jgi:hypothetical protein